MASSSNVRTLRFVLLAFFSIAVIYKIFASSYSPTGAATIAPIDGKTTSKLTGTSPSSEAVINPAPVVAAGGKGVTSPSTTEDTSHALSPARAPGARANATFITLARNSDIWDIAESIRHIEDRFNRKYNYDWVFLNDQPFDEPFKKLTSNLVSGKTKYGLIPKEHWSFPDWIDQEKAKAVREDMRERKIIYGDSISYRHMCRFESGFFFRHPLLADYEMYWRVEPSIKLFCDVDFDPFVLMKEKKKNTASPSVFTNTWKRFRPCGTSQRNSWPNSHSTLYLAMA